MRSSEPKPRPMILEQSILIDYPMSSEFLPCVIFFHTILQSFCIFTNFQPHYTSMNIKHFQIQKLGRHSTRVYWYISTGVYTMNGSTWYISNRETQHSPLFPKKKIYSFLMKIKLQLQYLIWTCYKPALVVCLILHLNNNFTWIFPVVPITILLLLSVSLIVSFFAALLLYLACSWFLASSKAVERKTEQWMWTEHFLWYTAIY